MDITSSLTKATVHATLHREHHLDFLPNKRSTSQQLLDALLLELENQRMFLANKINQEYDNVNNVKGEHI